MIQNKLVLSVKNVLPTTKTKMLKKEEDKKKDKKKLFFVDTYKLHCTSKNK